MRRLITIFVVFALCVPLASYAAYTEVPPFSATQFARQRGVFRWYRGCWWKVVDPNVYLFCNSDGTIYLLLPDGTLSQIRRQDAENIGLDDSGSRYYDPVKTKEDLRRISYRYTVPSQSTLTRFRNRTTYSTRFSNVYSGSSGTYGSSYGGDGTGVTSYSDGGYYGGSSGGSYGSSNGGTGIFYSDDSGSSGGSYGGGGYYGGSNGGSSYGGGGSYSGSYGGGGSYSGGGSTSGGGSFSGGGSTSGSTSGGGSTSGSTSGSTGGGSSGGGGDPDDFLNRPLNIACSSKDDIVDGGVFGPIPCTWFPDVFGPVPDYWGD